MGWRTDGGAGQTWSCEVEGVGGACDTGDSAKNGSLGSSCLWAAYAGGMGQNRLGVIVVDQQGGVRTAWAAIMYVSLFLAQFVFASCTFPPGQGLNHISRA